MREPQCLGPLLPTVINKDVQLDTHHVLSPLALRSKRKRREKRVESATDVSLLFMQLKPGSSLQESKLNTQDWFPRAGAMTSSGLSLHKTN